MKIAASVFWNTINVIFNSPFKLIDYVQLSTSSERNASPVQLSCASPNKYDVENHMDRNTNERLIPPCHHRM